MHLEAYQAVGRMVEAAGAACGLDFGHAATDNDGSHTGDPRAGLDIGGRDVNGTARDWFANTYWRGLDIRPGPGVDIVADATTWQAHRFPKSTAFVVELPPGALSANAARAYARAVLALAKR